MVDRRIGTALLLFPLALAIASGAEPAAAINGPPSDSIPRMTPADGWPIFRGNARMTGVVPGSAPGTIELAWSVETNDAIEATCAIADGVVYLATMDGRLMALGLEDGKEHWVFANPDLDGVQSSPCIAGDVVVYGDSAGVLRGIDRQTGKLRWQHATAGEIISSATFLQGRVLIGSYDESFYCLDAKTGEVAWTVLTQGPVHCSPTLVGEDLVAVAGCDGFLRLLAIADGSQKASLEIGGNIASTPAVIGEHLFMGTMSNQVLGIDIKTMRVSWIYEHEKRKFPFYSSPAVADDLVLIGGRDKMLHALRQNDGSERWSFSTRARIESSPVVIGKRVYFGCSDGSLYGLELSSGEKVWEYVTGNAVVASFAVANGRMVIANQGGTVFCFSTR